MIPKSVFLLILFSIGPIWLIGQMESDYIIEINNHFKGQTEVSIDGGRVDIVSEEYAIEVEYASKWKHAIGQSLWYAINTNKKAGIVLITKGTSDYKHYQRLNSTIDYSKLNIKVWNYPEDFKSSLSEKSVVVKEAVLPNSDKEIQFFISRYSNKSFPSISHLGKIKSKVEGDHFSYQLVSHGDAYLTLAKVRELGFQDAFIIDEEKKPKVSNSKTITKSYQSPSKNTSYKKSSYSSYTPRSASGCSTTRCTGRTQKGSRCKRKTTSCSGKCWQH